MTRLAWITDIHLNFVQEEKIVAFLKDIANEKIDILLITGDIGESHTVCHYLIRFVENLNLPIYFILGNHDYYFSSIEKVRLAVTRLVAEYTNLHWLPLIDVIELGTDTALVGHGCWSDGGYGNFNDSSIILNDYVLISELSRHRLARPALLTELQVLGKEGGDYLRRVLAKALEKYRHVYVALHSPPFRETAWHDGKLPGEDDPYLPHFTCKAAGDVLLEVASKYPDAVLTVLCGHTHGEGEVQVRSNLRVLTGGAEYGDPQIKRIFSC